MPTIESILTNPILTLVILKLSLFSLPTRPTYIETHNMWSKTGTEYTTKYLNELVCGWAEGHQKRKQFRNTIEHWWGFGLSFATNNPTPDFPTDHFLIWGGWRELWKSTLICKKRVPSLQFVTWGLPRLGSLLGSNYVAFLWWYLEHSLLI